MKYDNIGSFQRHVENTLSGHFLPVYLIVSADPLLARWLMEWMARLFKEFSPSHAAADLLPSLFSSKRLVMLECEEWPEELASFLAAPPQDLIALLSLKKVETSDPMFKKIEKVGTVLQSGSLKPWEKEHFFIDYLQRRAHSEKFSLAPDAAKAIVSRTAGDPFAIDAHYEKLTLWKHAEKRIALADVNMLGPWNEEENLFQFTDALLARKGGAFEMGVRLVEQGAAPLALLKTVRNAACLLYELRNHLEGRLSLDEVVARHPYLKGKILDQKLSLARMHPLKQFQQWLLKADELERYYKNRSGDEETFMELLAVSFFKE